MKKIFSILTMICGSIMIYATDVPTFPGGEDAMKSYISANTKYPAAAIDNGVEGIVVIDFIVNAEGGLENLKVSKFVDPDLEKEALRVVSGMPAWLPAEKDGRAVAAPMKVEIPFILE